MSLKDFQIVSKLGQGAYSTVYKVIRLEDSQPYALKRVKIGNLSSKQRQNALNQIRILASIRHINTICYKQAFIDQQTKSLWYQIFHISIVMQLANNRDLLYKIQDCSKKNEFIPEHQIWNMFIQIVQGLKQLHDRGIFHRDIKPANIFLHEYLVKLGDMNVSKISEKGLCMTQTGTPYYACPQVWKDKPYDEKSDIWSLGCVLYQMITLKPPFRGEDMEGLFKKVIRGIYPRIPSEYSNDLSTMVRLLLQTNPDQRPSCQKILNLPMIIKRLKSIENESNSEKTQLIRTIKAGTNNFYSVNEQLPKANYNPVKVKKPKGIKSLIDSIEYKQRHQQVPTIHEVQSLPFLQKQRKISSIQNNLDNSDRYMLVKQKHNIGNLLERERKKSQINSSRAGLQINGIHFNINSNNNQTNTINRKDQSISHSQQVQKQLKLPKVQNRQGKSLGQKGINRKFLLV